MFITLYIEASLPELLDTVVLLAPIQPLLISLTIPVSVVRNSKDKRYLTGTGSGNSKSGPPNAELLPPWQSANDVSTISTYE